MTKIPPQNSKEGQIMNENLEFRGRVPRFRAKNIPKGIPFEAKT